MNMLKQAAKVNSNFGWHDLSNQMLRIISQIYEIQTPAEAEMMVAAGVDHVGSVVVSAKQWRQPEIKATLEVVSRASAKSSLILLYNAPDLVFASLEYYRPDIVHFCEILLEPAAASSSPQMGIAASCDALVSLQAEIRRSFPGIRIMRTIPIPDAPGGRRVPYLELAALFSPVSDYFLTDTLMVGQSGHDPQPVAGFVGITGKTCDWQSAARLVDESPIPVILAGGLSPENVYEGIRMVRPAGVDSCTLTNASDAQGRPVRFKKDMVRVRRFLAEARRAAREV